MGFAVELRVATGLDFLKLQRARSASELMLANPGKFFISNAGAAQAALGWLVFDGEANVPHVRGPPCDGVVPCNIQFKPSRRFIAPTRLGSSEIFIIALTAVVR